jgi:hypothetical protein
MKNLDKLQEIALSRSTPGHQDHRKWLSHREVVALTRNREATSAVLTWLSKHETVVLDKTVSGEHIIAAARVEVWETLFNTNLFHWADVDISGNVLGTHIRAEHCNIHSSLATHISAIFNLCQAYPPVEHSGKRLNSRLGQALQSTSLVNPAFIDNLYKIPTTLYGNASLKQSVFETSNQRFVQSDLRLFQRKNGRTVQAAVDDGGSDVTSCTSEYDCDEANLDIQYIMGICQNTTSLVSWINDTVNGSFIDPFSAFVFKMANEANPPSVISISWGSIEVVRYSTIYDSANHFFKSDFS